MLLMQITQIIPLKIERIVQSLPNFHRLLTVLLPCNLAPGLVNSTNFGQDSQISEPKPNKFIGTEQNIIQSFPLA